MPMSSPARTAWERNAECMASRTTSLPRNENDRLEMPPLVRAPGQRSLISGRASMNAFAYPLCSEMPVATASTFGSKMTSSAAKPATLTSRVVGPAADLDLAVTGVGLTLLVEGHHYHAGAEVADPTGVFEEDLLALLEADRVDHALALHAFEPGLEHAPLRAVNHDRNAGHLGLGGNQVEESGHRTLAVEQVGVHVHVEQVGAAAHLVERDVDGALVVAALDESAETGRAGHVGPLADHDEAGVGADREGLEAAEAGGFLRRGDVARPGVPHRLRDLFDMRRACAAAAAHDVDQPGVGELGDQFGRLHRGLVVAAERVRKARVGVGGDEAAGDAGQLGHVRPDLRRTERAVDPHDQRPARSIESQNASTVCPERVRPDRSTNNEIQSGRAGATSRAAAMAAFAFSVSKIVSISSRSTPPSASAAICSAYDALTWSKVTARKAGSSTLGETERVTLSGPTEPATNRPPTSSAACRASWAPRMFISRTFDSRP